MELLLNIFSAFGLSASAGLNAYIPLLTVALLGRFTDLIELKSPWDTLESPWVIGALAVLLLIEFFADKAPAVNHINDAIQTFVRPAAGAIVFAASANVISNMRPVLALILGILVAGGVHTVKSVAVRPAVTATTAGVANTPVSIAEDVASTVVSLISVIVPALLLLIVLALFFWISWRMLKTADQTE
jgi:hypothetical protein